MTIPTHSGTARMSVQQRAELAIEQLTDLDAATAIAEYIAQLGHAVKREERAKSRWRTKFRELEAQTRQSTPVAGTWANRIVVDE